MGVVLGSLPCSWQYQASWIGCRAPFRLGPEELWILGIAANSHANSRKRDRVDEIWDVMRARGVKKVPGFSWIELSNKNVCCCR